MVEVHVGGKTWAGGSCGEARTVAGDIIPVGAGGDGGTGDAGATRNSAVGRDRGRDE